MDNTTQRLPYYPNQGYLDKNWRPETFSAASLAALAKAQKIAVANKVLSEQLAAKMLPNALTEGWDMFGVLGGRYGYPATPSRDNVLRSLGLSVSDDSSPDADIVRYGKDGYQINPQIVDKDRQVEINARLAAAILAEKARLYGEDNAIERWNGKGSAIERYAGLTVPANAKNHAAKVAEVERMLAHPANATILEAYQQMLADKPVMPPRGLIGSALINASPWTDNSQQGGTP